MELNANSAAYRAPLRAPFTACLWITDYCNLNCSYCYAKPFSGTRMQTERLLKLIDEFVTLGVFDLTLAGGEPTLHPAFIDIVDRAIAGGIRVGVLSNGVSLSEELIASLETRTNQRNFMLQVSIDSTDPAVNDVSRGKTAKVLRTLDRLRKSPIQVQLATVINRKNLTEAHTIIDKYYPDFKRFHFLNIQRTESALSNPELLIEEDEALKFWLNLNEFSKKFPDDLFLPSLRIQMRALGRSDVDPEASLHHSASFDCESCSAGLTQVNITSKFDVLGCDIAKDFTWMGNISDVPFETVWHSKTASQVRKAPYPACYKIKDPTGATSEASLKPQFNISRIPIVVV